MSPAVLVDTDVFSFLYKADTRASLYSPHLAGTRPHLAFQLTFCERHLYRIARPNV